MRRLARLVAVPIALYALICLGMYLAQDDLLYPGLSRTVGKERATLSGYTALTVRSSLDGIDLRHWYRPADGAHRPTLLMFHGNGGLARYQAGRLRSLTEQGYGLFAMEYRGFAGRPGHPSEAALKQDARDALDALNRHGVPDTDVVAYGRSLGTGIAVALAAERDLHALILEAPYRSIKELAIAAYPWLPVRLLLKDPWDSLPLMGRINEPLLVLHGGADRIIPVAHGRDMMDAAAGPTHGSFPPGAGHNNLFRYGGLAQIRAFLDALSEETPPHAPEP